MPSIFTKIINREIPADILHEDDHCIVIKDIQPQAPIHLLVIPKKEIRSLADAEAHDQALLGHLLLTAQKVAKDLGFADSGFRMIANTNKGAGQTVFHLHFHILAGKTLNWP